MATASPGNNALQSWERRPDGISVAAQWQQVFTTTAIASWQCEFLKRQSTTAMAMAMAIAMATAILCSKHHSHRDASPLSSNRVLSQWWQVVTTTWATAHSWHEHSS